MNNHIDALFETDPFEFSDQNKQLFIDSIREAAEIHYYSCKLFRALWDERGLSPNAIKTESDLKSIPPIMVNLFKERELISGSKDDIELTLTSSGTGGQKSQIFLNHASLARVKKLAWQIHKSLGMVSDEKVNYLCFTYDPKIASDLGTAFTDELLTSFTDKHEVYYAIQWDRTKKDFYLNREGVVKKLIEYEKDKFPVRILGFPAHLYKIIKDYRLKLKLGISSWVQTGGGWKGFADEELPKEKFREFVSQSLGLPIGNIRDMFGMVEHGIPYCDCKKGKLHIPNYSRVYIRDPRDLSIVPDGEIGLIQLLCSYNTSYPALSLLTTDWGRVGTCSCGLAGNTLEIIGRAGIKKHKGCAITASKFLEG